MLYTIFSQNGQVSRVILKPNSDGYPKLKGGEIYVEGDHKNKIYLNGQIIDKPKSKITLTGTKLENLPNPTIVTISGNGATFRETIEDGEFEFSVDVPGEYVVKCESKVELPVEYKVVIK